jgi:prepilin-type N-terminal cleavage/methylation domain-containing protein
MKMKRSNRGLTLIEVLIASVILAVISLAIYLLIERGSSTYATASRHATLQASARQIVERLCEELRIANPLTLKGGPGKLEFQKRLSFDPVTGVTLWGPTVTYFTQTSVLDLDNDLIEDDQLLRTGMEDTDGDGTPDKVVTSKLSDYVKKGSFIVTSVVPPANPTPNDPLSNKISVALTLMLTDTKGKVVSTTVSSTVTVRNPR